MNNPQRKAPRLKGYDYNFPGYYFITICTRGKEKLLCEIDSCRDSRPRSPESVPHCDATLVGTGLPDCPSEKSGLDGRIFPLVFPAARLDLSDITLYGPQVRLTPMGSIVDSRLRIMREFYGGLVVEKYVIMPNHIHLLIHIFDVRADSPDCPVQNDRANSKISRFVGTLKRFCNREIGYNIWQSRFHDHIIRGEHDYLKIWEYIDNNPAKWADDCFYTP